MKHPTLYDDVPHNGTATSRAAAASQRGKRESTKAIILGFLRRKGTLGATDDEGEWELDIAHQTYTPARLALEREGRVQKTDQTRPTRRGRQAAVWVAVREAMS